MKPLVLLCIPLYYFWHYIKQGIKAWNDCYLKSYQRMVALQQCHLDCLCIFLQKENNEKIISAIGKECARAVRPWNEE